MAFTRARFSRKWILVLLSGLSVVVLVVLLLGVESLKRPGNGISRSDAINVAWQHTGSGVVAARSAEVTHNFQTGFNLPTHRWAWVVTFSGQWHLLCSGHTADASCDPTFQWVAIDYYTGQWIASEFSYPAGP
jgi:hypothetical protein